MPIESPYMTCLPCYLIAVLFLPYLSSFPWYSLSKCAWLDLDLKNIRWNVSMSIESPCITWYFMPIVIYSILSPFPWYSLSKYALLWPWPLEWVMVKSKYASRKPKHDFPFTVKSHLCHICHLLRDNHIWTFQILPTSILYLEVEIEGQGHEK